MVLNLQKNMTLNRVTYKYSSENKCRYLPVDLHTNTVQQYNCQYLPVLLSPKSNIGNILEYIPGGPLHHPC